MNLPRTTNWQMTYREWQPREQRHREALCTLGNGHFATRGAFEGARADQTHYPGTYMNGGYNRRSSQVAGREIENEDLVNLPNWLCLNFKPGDGDWLDLDQVEWLEFEQTLDLQRGLLHWQMHFRDRAGRETRLTTRRLVHMANRHLAAIEWNWQPVNWSGPVTFRSAIDGSVENQGVARYQKLESKHLQVVNTEVWAEDYLLLRAMTNQSRLQIGEAVRTRIDYGQSSQPPPKIERRLLKNPESIGQDLSLQCKAGETLRIEKIAALFSSRDRAICEPGLDAQTEIKRAPDFATLQTSHQRAWKMHWRDCDLELELEPETEPGPEQLTLRLHIFHLLQTTSPHTIDLDAGVPARGLHGEAYRGHIFWDELFIFPFLNTRLPQITRALLMYRYRRLDEARQAARAAGLAGAMYPWQSGSNGREESQLVHLNPKSGRWLPDHTYRQRHINAAIAHNIWHYYQVTNDYEFMVFAGIEMILGIAQFWASSAVFNQTRQRYEIRGIAGPDEFHTGYPDRDQPGLDNNAYTNLMASWCLQLVGPVLELLAPTRRRNLLQTLEISGADLEDWQEKSRKMFVPFHDHDIISQFEGYEKLEELDWSRYREKYQDIQRLDRILEQEGDDINRYKASKQADVLMLFYLFTTEQIKQLFSSLGYPFTPAMIPRNIEYYQQRTSHGSTLSRIVDSWILTRSDRQQSWHLFGQALMSDIGDIQGGTTGEGIHLGAMAGTIDLVQRCYCGLEIRNQVLWLNPALPDELRQITQKIHYRGHWITIMINHQKLRIELAEGPCPPIKIGFRRRAYWLKQGQVREFKYPSKYWQLISRS